MEVKIVLECEHQPAMVILKEKYAKFKCIKCGKIYKTNILSILWGKRKGKIKIWGMYIILMIII